MPRLSRMVPALLVGMVVLTSAAFAVLDRADTLGQFEDHQRTLLSVQGTSLAAFLERDLERDDQRGAAYKVALTATTPHARRVVVFDERDRVLASAGAPTADGPLAGLPASEVAAAVAAARTTNTGNTSRTSDGASLVGVFPVQLAASPGELRGTRRGVLLVEYHLLAERARASDKAWLRTATGTGIAIVLGSTVWLLVHLLLTLRARRLIEATRALAAGDLAVRAEVSGRDELAELAGAFNSMAESVRSASEERRNAERQLRAIVENMPAGIVCLGPDGRVTYVNPATERLLDCPSARFIGEPWPGGLRIEALDGSALGSAGPAQGALRTGEAVAATDYGISQGARRIAVRGQAAPLHDDAFAVVGSIEVLIDITRWVEAEAARAKLEDALARAQRLEALGTLAGGIAHDFNNILTAIIANAEIARQATDQPILKEPLEDISAAGLRARDLVRQILLFARRTDVERTPVSLDVVVREALKLARATLPTTIELLVDLDADAPTVLANASQIHQIVINLVVNAAHAMAGVGCLEVKLGRTQVGPTLAASHAGLHAGAWTRLSVRDTGAGMPPDVLEHAFDPFFTTKGPGEGSGLGLAVVHGIVATHGGVITLHSEVGLGAQFDIYFPPFVETQEESSQVRLGPSRTLAGRKAVVVDDEPAVLRVVVRALERNGVEVTAFGDSEAALRHCLAAPLAFDLLVTDQTMPRLTGQQLAKAVREVREDVPIVLMSGRDGRAVELVAGPPLVALPKPFTPAELRGAVQHALVPQDFAEEPTRDVHPKGRA